MLRNPHRPKDQLAARLFQIGAIQFGAFRLKLHERKPDAPLSPIFVNLRTPENPKAGRLGLDELELIGQLFHEQTSSMTFEALCGIPNAGEPIAHACAALFSGPKMHMVKLTKKIETENRSITGIADTDHCVKGNIILLVDDVISEADSKIEAIKVLHTAGFIVNDVFVVVDRQMGGAQELASIGVRLHSLFTLSGLCFYYLSHNVITFEQAHEVINYLLHEAGAF